MYWHAATWLPRRMCAVNFWKVQQAIQASASGYTLLLCQVSRVTLNKIMRGRFDIFLGPWWESFDSQCWIKSVSRAGRVYSTLLRYLGSYCNYITFLDHTWCVSKWSWNMHEVATLFVVMFCCCVHLIVRRRVGRGSIQLALAPLYSIRDMFHGSHMRGQLFCLVNNGSVCHFSLNTIKTAEQAE